MPNFLKNSTGIPRGTAIVPGDISNLTNSNLSGSAAITNANLAAMADQTIKGNNSGGSAVPLDLTTTQVTAMLNVFSSSLKGLVPASGGGTTNFLRADGTWTTAGGSSTSLNPQVSVTLGANAVGTWYTAGLTNGSYSWYAVAYQPPQYSISTITARFVAVGSGTPNNAAYNDGSGWTQVSTPDGTAYTGVAHSPELGMFAAVGNQKIMTSINGGTSWTARTSPENDTWYAIAWSPELSLFCAVSNSAGSDAHSVMTSPNGTTWTVRTGVNNFHWTSIVWCPSLSLFVAVGYGGTDHVMTSPDGITWTGRTDAGAGFWSSVTWSPELSLLVAVSLTTSGSGAAMTSPDGVNWTSRTLPGDGSQWYGVNWSPELGLFAAVNRDATVYSIATSPDGITWTGRVASEQNGWNAIAWGAQFGEFMAVSNNNAGTNFSMRSKIVKKFIAP